MKQNLKEIYDYRQMIIGLIRRDLRGRYKGSLLGFLWTFINPLLQLLVYTLVFGVLLKNKVPDFYLYVFVGLIPWLFFSSCLVGGSEAIISQQRLVTKVYFPREVLPISYVTSSFINMLCCFIIVMAVYLFSAFTSFDGGFHWTFPPTDPTTGLTTFSFLPLLALPLVFLIEYIMCLGMTLFTSAITVYVRDVRHILGIVGMLWMFSTPIMWKISNVLDPGRMERWGWLFLYVNPMTGIIEACHSILYNGAWPNFTYLAASAGWAILAIIVGIPVFNKAKKHFAEEL
ncbi:MAG: ABC transporter permease [Bacilli bacterium]|nr:ABC transporter permease [Bacilli bacterium]